MALDYSQYVLEAFGTRQNAIECMARGERPSAHDPRVVGAMDWMITIFLNETMPAEIKSIPGWMTKAKVSLGVVCDLVIDEYRADYGDKIYTEYFLSEGLKAVENCIKNHEW